MKPPSRRALLLSLPVLALAWLALAGWGVGQLRGLRIDLTDNGAFTLAPGTQRILAKLPAPVRMELFYSSRAAQSQPQFRVFAQHVGDLLEEIASRSGGRVTLVTTDPEPFSADEDRATAAGLAGVPLGEGGDKLYFGLVLRGGGRQAAIPFFQPARESLFEYDVMRAIAGLSVKRRPVLALLSTLPMGPGIEPFTGRPTPGWVLDRQLAESFDLRRLQDPPTDIPRDVDLLMVVHPRGLPEATEAAIDQFVLRGGRLLVFVDPDAESDAADPAVASFEAPRASTLPRLFAAWGLRFDPAQVVLDAQNASRIQPDPGKPPVRHPGVLGLHAREFNQSDVATAGLASVNLSSVGALSLEPDATATLEALLQSSSDAMLADAVVVRRAQGDPARLADGLRPDGGAPYVLAARLGGRLRSAFPALPGGLRESAKPAQVVVVADTDLLSDGLWVQSQEFLGQSVATAFANNADLVYNLADNLVGNDDLIGLRTRPSATRPFARVDAVRRRAELRYQAKARQLEQQLAALEQDLARLQPPGVDGQAPRLDAAQQAQLAQVQERRAAMRRELRGVQGGLNAEIDAIGTRLKLLDILAVPALVLVLALLIAWRRHQRRQEAIE